MKNDIFKFVVEIPKAYGNKEILESQFGTLSKTYYTCPLGVKVGFEPLPAEITHLYMLVSDIANSTDALNSVANYTAEEDYGYVINSIPNNICKDSTGYSLQRKLFYSKKFTRVSFNKEEETYTPNVLTISAYIENIDNGDIMRMCIDVEQTDGCGGYAFVKKDYYSMDDWTTDILTDVPNARLFKEDGNPIYSKRVFGYDNINRCYSEIKTFLNHVFDIVTDTILEHTSMSKQKAQ